MSDLDALEHDLDVSERRLERQLLARGVVTAEENDHATADVESAAESSQAAGAEPSAAPQPAPAPKAPPASEKRQERASADDACTLSCRALASMRRAAKGICDLVPADARCNSARRRVESAAERVAGAGCDCSE